jgi:alpha-glucosidase (family GH31 glycosyl hydrolase)
MHYLYTVFYQATQTGLPIIRPLWYEFRTDKTTFTINNQFMWGESIMVAPKMHEPTYSSGVYKQSIYLPNDETTGNTTFWYFYPTRSKVTPNWDYQDFYIGD